MIKMAGVPVFGCLNHILTQTTTDFWETSGLQPKTTEWDRLDFHTKEHCCLFYCIEANMTDPVKEKIKHSYGKV